MTFLDERQARNLRWLNAILDGTVIVSDGKSWTKSAGRFVETTLGDSTPVDAKSIEHHFFFIQKAAA